MKITLSNGKSYTRDHPKELQGFGLMGYEQIRQAWRECLADGWTEPALCVAMRCGKGSIKQRLRCSWIWPNEQKKFTVRLNEIREGYLVPRILNGRQEPVYIDPPEPPKGKDVRVLRMHVGIKGLSFAPPPPKFDLPDFSRAFSDVVKSGSKKWNRAR